MATVLELELEALARLSPQLRLLAGLLKGFGDPALYAPAAAPSDTPAMVAARSVTTETLPAVEETVADRFVVVGDLVERARIAFAESESSLTACITSAGNLLPPTAPGR